MFPPSFWLVCEEAHDVTMQDLRFAPFSVGVPGVVCFQQLSSPRLMVQ